MKATQAVCDGVKLDVFDVALTAEDLSIVDGEITLTLTREEATELYLSLKEIVIHDSVKAK